LRSNNFTEWIFTFFANFSDYFKKGVGRKTFLLITFPKKSLLLKFSLETVQKAGKIMDIHFFDNIAFEKNLPVKTL